MTKVKTWEAPNNTDISSFDEKKIELFEEYASLLTLEQWQYIFKQPARLSPQERRKLPKDYSAVLEETIS